jgi:NADPH-dependent 2,4-dienoyl-CoA reductase/sulfur reductase-like enzyme
LLLSLGAKPFKPAIAGLDEAEHVYTIRNVPDIDLVMEELEKQPKKAVVVGAGFIGLEMAENLKKRGLEVTIIELSSHVLPNLDEEMASYIQNELTKQKVTVRTNCAVTAFENNGQTLRLNDGTTIHTDFTILSVGVQPDSNLAKMAGLKTGMRGGIVVNEQYQTSDPSIYAVGDAIIVKHQITGEDALISLASPANRQGRQVADTIAGIPRKNQGSLGTSILRVFDQSAASTGLTEKMAKQANLPFSVVHVSGKNHASYYPQATDILLKLVFNPKTGEIYGAQGIGEKGVDKRIDSLATAIKGNLTIFDLPELEFTYAPPFGSAKDPVNMLGYVAMNVAEGLSEMVQWHELRCRIKELDPEQEYVVSCHSGLRSYLAERILKQAGFKVKNLDGAFALYHTVRPKEIVDPQK